MRIAFVWQGISGRYGQWKDGLYAAMKHIEREHEVRYFEPNDQSIEEFKPDWILYWESPVTYNGKDGNNYRRIMGMPFKKALLFAGGEIKPELVYGFDHLFIESAIDMDTCERYGLPHSRAFGINDEIFRSECQPKIWDGMHHSTCASWKRTWLMTKALKSKSFICGRFQESDPRCWLDARDHGALILPEQSAESVNSLLNASHCLVQTSEFWGGGQRATLEAISAGIPVVCMEDSPKNREFVEESRYGLVVKPESGAILDAVERIKKIHWNIADAMEYKKKWSSKKYAEDILKVLCA